MSLVLCLVDLVRGSRSIPNCKPPQVRWERRNWSLRTLWIGFMRQWTRHIHMSQMIVMNGPSLLGCHKWSVTDGPSRTSCHRHTSDFDQTSYSGMAARTICEDSVRNYRSKLPWIKRQLTNRQEQVAIDIIMNVPPWTNRHNQITTMDMSSRYHVMLKTCEQSEWWTISNHEFVMPSVFRLWTWSQVEVVVRNKSKPSRRESRSQRVCLELVPLVVSSSWESECENQNPLLWSCLLGEFSWNWIKRLMP